MGNPARPGRIFDITIYNHKGGTMQKISPEHTLLICANCHTIFRVKGHGDLKEPCSECGGRLLFLQKWDTSQLLEGWRQLVD